MKDGKNEKYHAICWNHEPEQGPLRNRQEEKTRVCFEKQTNIGWENLFLGRISISRGERNEELTKHYEHLQDATAWNAKFIREAMKLTLNLWISMNKQTHGNNGGTSIAERDNAMKTYKYIIV